MQQQPVGTDSIFHLFVITAKEKDALVKHLQANGVNPGFHYPVPCHLQKAYSHLHYKAGDCPNSEYLATHCLSLPMYAELKEEEVTHVIHTLNQF